MKHIFYILTAAAFIVAACQKGENPTPDSDITISPERSEKVKPSGPYTGCIPTKIQGIPRVYIVTPSGRGVKGIDEKRDYDADINEWTKDCTVEIRVTTLSGKDSVCYSATGMKIRGRGNSTWTAYTKKRPYNIKLDKKADFFGTGSTKRYLLLANWMDRTLLRNEVAFEAARRTLLEWTPSGRFVELYVDGEHRFNYWLGEKVNVEESHFLADYQYDFDISKISRTHFRTKYGIWKKGNMTGDIPVELEYPDLDDVPGALEPAKEALYKIEETIYNGDWGPMVDADSFCDWFLVNEVTGNAEPTHPKSFKMYIRDGVLYAGPVWDFDYGTFVPGSFTGTLIHRNTVYFGQLLKSKAFRERMKKRWTVLKPRFESLDEYIDQMADVIRTSEAANHEAFPCFPNPLSEDFDDNGKKTGYVNYDEQLSFQEAVNSMKAALKQRIQEVDALVNKL